MRPVFKNQTEVTNHTHTQTAVTSLQIFITNWEIQVAPCRHHHHPLPPPRDRQKRRKAGCCQGHDRGG